MTSPACVEDWLRAAYADITREKPRDLMAAMAERCRQKAASVAGLRNTELRASTPLSDDRDYTKDPQMFAYQRIRELGVPHFLWYVA